MVVMLFVILLKMEAFSVKIVAVDGNCFFWGLAVLLELSDITLCSDIILSIQKQFYRTE
jgi:hypothetical protein